MEALASALERSTRSPARRRWALGALVGLGAIGLGYGSKVADDPCDGPGPTWDDATRARLQAGFDASGSPHAGDGWTRLQGDLETWVEAWSSAHREVCEGAPPPAVDDPRIQCLRRGRRRFDALVRAFEQAPATAVEDAGLAGTKLDRPHRCLSTDEVQESHADDPRWEAIDGRLVEADALATAFRLDEARQLAGRALEEAKDAGLRRLEAEAELQLGLVDIVAEHFDLAQSHLERAYFLADELRDHRTAAVAASKLVFALSMGDGTEAEADRWAAHAQAHLQQMPEHGPVATVLLSLGIMQFRRGAYDAAAEYAVKASDAFAADYGPEHPSVAQALSNGGLARISGGQVDEGLELLRRASAIYGRTLGESHPARISTILNLGLGQYRLGRYSEALATFDRALELQRAGPDDATATLGRLLVDRALCLVELDRAEEALDALLEARARLRGHLGDDHPLMATVAMNIGLVHHVAGRFDQALPAYERAWAAQIAILGSDHPEAALTEHNLGVTLNALHRYPEAAEHLRSSLAVFETKLGPDADYAGLSKLELGRALDGLGRPEEALPVLDSALAILAATGDERRRFVVMGRMYRGRALLHTGRPDAAAESLDAALDLARTLPDPDPGLSAELYVERAHLARVRGHAAQARQELDAARALVDDSPAMDELRTQIADESRALGD